MQIVIEEIDNVYYADVILNQIDLETINQGLMVTEEVYFKHRKCHVGVRFQGEWDNVNQVKRPEKSKEGDEGIWGRQAPQRVKGRPRRHE